VCRCEGRSASRVVAAECEPRSRARVALPNCVSETAARRQVAATFAGLAALLQDRAPDFSELARDHATRGGTNEQFLGVLVRARVFDAVDSGLNQVLDRLTRR
jgi:pyrroline-5-carboxylate reductase